MEADIGTNPPASAGAEGVQGANDPGYEAGSETLDADQGNSGQSDGDQLEGAEGDSPELVEFEYQGKKYTIAKDLEPALMKDADYTQKTQEVAETKRQLEQQFSEREQQFELRQQAAQVLQQGRAQVAALDMQLQQFAGINWEAASAQDPAATQQAWMRFQQLRDQRLGVANQLQAAEQQFASKVQQDAQERVRSVVSKWTPEEVQAVNEIGTNVYGITAQHMALFGSNPALLQILKDAVMHQKAMKTAAQATKPAAPKPQAQPVPTIPQGRTAQPKTLNDSTLSMDEWVRRRNEQVRKRKA